MDNSLSGLNGSGGTMVATTRAGQTTAREQAEMEQLAAYTAAETSTYAVQAIESAKKNQERALALDIADIRDYFAPVQAGQLTAIIAQTSNYKSGFMHFWERLAAEQLQEQGREDEVIVHISVEECVEEQAYLLLAREAGEDAGRLARGEVQDWNRLMQAAVRIGQIPIYRIGHSLARAEQYPNLYLSNMVRSVRYLQDRMFDHKVTIAAIFCDYLQAFPIDPEVQKTEINGQRRLQVREDIYRLRRMAATFDCPVIVGVQARQNLTGSSGANMLLPGVYDAEETASIAQRCDRIISLWMPKMTHTVGDTLNHGAMHFTVEENLLFIKVAKQRGGLPSGRIWKCRINFQENTIAPEYGAGFGEVV